MVAELVKKRVRGFGRRNAKGFVERLIRRLHAQVLIQDQQGFAYCIDDALGKSLRVFGELLGLF